MSSKYRLYVIANKGVKSMTGSNERIHDEQKISQEFIERFNKQSDEAAKMLLKFIEKYGIQKYNSSTNIDTFKEDYSIEKDFKMHIKKDAILETLFSSRESSLLVDLTGKKYAECFGSSKLNTNASYQRLLMSNNKQETEWKKYYDIEKNNLSKVFTLVKSEEAANVAFEVQDQINKGAYKIREFFFNFEGNVYSQKKLYTIEMYQELQSYFDMKMGEWMPKNMWIHKYYSMIFDEYNIFSRWHSYKEQGKRLKELKVKASDKAFVRSGQLAIITKKLYELKFSDGTAVSDKYTMNQLKRIFYEYNKYKEGAEMLKVQSENYVDEYVDKLKKSHNIILRGAPGTGKTYLARQIAQELTGLSKDELLKSEQYAFVQFHPSYDYTDFVEGLRPSNSDESDEIYFELKNGIFKKFCKNAIKNSLNIKNNSESSFHEAWDKLVKNINESDDAYVMENTSVGATINTRGNIKFKSPVATKERVLELYVNGSSELKYPTYQEIVLKHLYKKYDLKPYVNFEEIEDNNDKKYVFIIDEINRGEISKIFGELFFSIDPGYRGDKNGVLTQYSNLHSNPNEKFYVPDNVYIIGTMNDIDRSVDSFDFAMRRRFRFVEVKASDRLNMLDEVLGKKAEKAKKVLNSLNNQISEIEGLNENYHIGPSYFLKLKELNYNYDELWNDYIEPLLEEYLRGTYSEKEDIQKLKVAYNLSNNDQSDEIKDTSTQEDSSESENTEKGEIDE